MPSPKENGKVWDSVIIPIIIKYINNETMPPLLLLPLAEMSRVIIRLIRKLPPTMIHGR
ncbi:hypothetical protein D3C76_1495780 [compost metagenome]